MRNAAAGIYRLYRCRRGVAGRGSRAAVGDIQKENDSFISVGASKPDANLNPIELAAYANLASLILNLDETITRN